MRIQHAHVSECVRFFKQSLYAKYKLRALRDKSVPGVIFGMYNNTDYKLYHQHKHPLVVVWCGGDAMNIDPRRAGVLKDRAEIHRHVAISSFISDDLKKWGIDHQVLPIMGSDWVLNPVPRGNCIYFYGPEKRGEVYGSQYLPEIAKKTSLRIHRAHATKYGRTTLYKLYADSFIGLRLTKHDGLPNTVMELGMMGRRSIYNGGTPHSIPWKGVDDICESIMREYEHRREDNIQISRDIKEFLNIGESWLHIDDEFIKQLAKSRP